MAETASVIGTQVPRIRNLRYKPRSPMAAVAGLRYRCHTNPLVKGGAAASAALRKLRGPHDGKGPLIQGNYPEQN